MKWQTMACFLALIIVVASCKPLEKESALHSESAVKPKELTYLQVRQSLIALQSLHSEYMSLRDYGLSHNGQPLSLVTISSKSKEFKGTRPAILMTEAIHGDEYLHFSDALPKLFLNQLTETQISKSHGLKHYIQSGGIVIIVPVVNPDGFDLQTRENAKKKDLNRTFPLVSEDRSDINNYPRYLIDEELASKDWPDGIEVQYLINAISNQLIKDHAQLLAFVDYHCCALEAKKSGDELPPVSLIHPWGYALSFFNHDKSSEELPTEDLDRHKFVANLMRNHLKEINQRLYVGNAIDLVTYPAKGASEDSIYAHYMERWNKNGGRPRAVSFAYEGVFGAKNNLVEVQMKFWNDLLQDIVDNYE